MSPSVTRADRRHTRRAQTLAEVVDVAVAVMSEQGAGGLTLGEVARRMGIATPSLYVYFASKNALYDAVFARGWRELHAAVRADLASPDEVPDLSGYLMRNASGFVQWAMEHPASAELMTWRPIPGYQPSPESYACAVETLDEARVGFERLCARGLLRPDVDLERALGAWTVLVAGVVTQQLANAPHEPFAGGTFTRLLPDLVEMFVRQYGSTEPGIAPG